MPQLSLYLDDPTMDYLRAQADGEEVSLSKYVGSMLKDRASSAWPAGFFNLYGSIDDDTFVEPEDLPFSLDTPSLEL